MRDMTTLIGCMLCLIPKEDNLGLYEELEEIKDSSMYQPPESMLCVERVGELLYEELGATPPTSGWQGDVAKIWMGKGTP